MAIEPDNSQEQESFPEKTRQSISERITGYSFIFKPSPGYFITPIIMYMNIIIFIIMVITGVHVFEPENESLLNWGANFRPLTLDGEWWRLITNCFLHIGVIHLLMNMYALMYIGILLEPQIGKLRFSAAYLLAGVSASLTSLWWNDLTISAGASGAIFGMYGLFLALLLTKLIDKSTRKELLISISIFVIYNLVYGLKGGIDNAAHIGGLVSGLIIGFAFYPGLKKPEEPGLTYLAIALLTLVLAGTTYYSLGHISNDIAIYDQRMNEFVENESMALEVYKLPEDSPDELILNEIESKGLFYWNENVKLITELEQLNLPDEIHDRNKVLLEYCDLRIKSYELISKAISEGSDQYWDQLEDYNNQIEKIINDLTGQ
jgi:rhomboid protease GluP